MSSLQSRRRALQRLLAEGARGIAAWRAVGSGLGGNFWGRGPWPLRARPARRPCSRTWSNACCSPNCPACWARPTVRMRPTTCPPVTEMSPLTLVSEPPTVAPVSTASSPLTLRMSPATRASCPTDTSPFTVRADCAVAPAPNSMPPLTVLTSSTFARAATSIEPLTVERSPADCPAAISIELLTWLTDEPAAKATPAASPATANTATQFARDISFSNPEKSF